MAQPLRSERNEENETLSYRSVLAGQKAETRRRILASARQVFLRGGYMDANLNEVASRAGVGKGTLYRHFESKGELYVAMLSEHGEGFVRAMDAAVDHDASALCQLEQLGNFYLDFWMKHPDHFQLIWAMQNRELIGPFSTDLMTHVRAIFEAPLRRLEALIRVGVEAGELRRVDPWHTANMLAFCATGIIGPIVRGAQPVVSRDIHAVYQQFRALIHAGLAPQPAADPR